MKHRVLSGVWIVFLFVLAMVPSQGSFVKAASTTDYMWINEYNYTLRLPNDYFYWPTFQAAWSNGELQIFPDYHHQGNNYYSWWNIPYTLILYSKFSENGKVLDTKLMPYYITYREDYDWKGWILNSGKILQIYSLPGNAPVPGYPIFLTGAPELNFVIRKIDPSKVGNSSILWATKVTIKSPTKFLYPYTQTYENVSGIFVSPDVVITGTGICEDNSGGAYISMIVEVVFSNGVSQRYPLLMRVNSHGDVLWVRMYPIKVWNIYGVKLVSDKKDNVYIEIGIGNGMTLMKVSPTGKLLWSKYLFHHDVTTQSSYALLLSPDESRIFVATTYFWGNYRVQSAVFSTAGKLLSERGYNVTSNTKNLYFWNLYSFSSRIDVWGENGPVIVQNALYEKIENGEYLPIHLPTLLFFDSQGNLKELKLYNLTSVNSSITPMSLAKSSTGDLTIIAARTVPSRDIRWVPVEENAVFEIFKLDPNGNIACKNCVIRSVKPIRLETTLQVIDIQPMNASDLNFTIDTLDPSSGFLQVGMFNPPFPIPIKTIQWCYAERTLQSQSTSQTSGYVTAGIVWYLLYKHYYKLFNETYSEISLNQTNSSEVQKALQLQKKAVENYNIANSKGVLLLFPAQSVPYLRKAYLNILEAYKILEKYVGE